MKLAIASGKGGTGKTTVSVALALSADKEVVYLDCDVEEPNGKLFLHPQIDVTDTVSVPVPVVNRELCNGCGDCADICEFNAIVSQGEYAIVFPELCHSCGGCMYACPENAIIEEMHPIGSLIHGRAGKVQYVEGVLNIGVAMATPLIKAVKEHVAEDGLSIIDSPPGTSCSMVTTVRDADFVLLVTEPTPFGLHDLKIAVKTVEELGRPFAVIINRFDQLDNCVDTYCQEEGIAVLLRIPENRKVAEAYSRGEPLLSALPDLEVDFRQMLSAIEDGLRAGANG
ncbi:(4Fe-4S)-binding protein [Vibrio sp. HA2012]|uniref:ATP-binding protein n=1 Tax=Vibrio sp. HA2012 TaxID=1971595 RepID=UPI000C2B6AE6|nr:ATP-binding protein [Vibrio sp. HA2012]PJC86717.1 (4Fe-4S)-binding protein [Vibrio sp. HA2012]